MREITLRQIEVIRAVVMRGTINGAAEHLNVSAPGVSRIIKHAEQSLGIRLFERKAGLFVPSMEAQTVFDQIRQVYKGVENLQAAIGDLQRGGGVGLAFASAPSIGQFVAADVILRLRQRYPDLFIDLNIVKYEETLDYVLLERGEFVLMTSPLANPGITMDEVGYGRVVAVLPVGHPLANQASLSIEALANEPMIAVDPADPYGAQLMLPFVQKGLQVKQTMRGRFAQTVVSLVRLGLGVAVIDEFSVAEREALGVEIRPLIEPIIITVYAMRKKDRVLSKYAETAIDCFRQELQSASSR